MLASAMLLAASAFAAEGDNYWYIRGAFNNYLPNGDEEWALMDDDEGEPGVYTGTFTVPAGAFSFNLVNSLEQIFVPMDEEGYASSENVDFSASRTFNGLSVLATDDYEELCYWTDSDWAGGMITVTVNANGNNPAVRIDAIPAVNDFDENYVLTPLNDEGIISIMWNADNIVDAWHNEGVAYLQPVSGDPIELVIVASGREGQVTIIDAVPVGIQIDITSLELADGLYTLVIPAKYIDIESDGYDVTLYNPEIEYTFEYKAETGGISAIQSAAAEGNVFTLQGVKVKDANNLQNGIYIINGKKVMIRK